MMEPGCMACRAAPHIYCFDCLDYICSNQQCIMLHAERSPIHSWMTLADLEKKNSITNAKCSAFVYDMAWNKDLHCTGCHEELILDIHIIPWSPITTEPCYSMIHVSEKDYHVFFCDILQHLIDEYTEEGIFVGECELKDETNKFKPYDICSLSQDILVVACGYDKRLIYLKRVEPQEDGLVIENIIVTEERFYSLCQMEGTIYACDYFFQIVSFDKDGKKIKTIKNAGLTGNCPLIRADPTTKILWLRRKLSSEISCFKLKNEIAQQLETVYEITDFAVNELGCFYFCNQNGIFTFSSKKYLYEFEERSACFLPKIFALKNKIFVFLRQKNKFAIKIFPIDSHLKAKKIIMEDQWNLPYSYLGVNSIQVSIEDDHVFLCCGNDGSIIEYNPKGEVVGEVCLLKDGTKSFFATDMCFLSSDTLVVVAHEDPLDGNETKLFYLERKQNFPLKIKNIIHTEKEFQSLCPMNKTILALDVCSQVDSFKRNGEVIKILDTVELLADYWPRIRADSEIGNFWLKRFLSFSELMYCNSNGENLKTTRIDQLITDFCLDEFGDLYFCNHEGIYSFNPIKTLHTFTKQSEIGPSIIVLKNRMSACIRVDARDVIIIFKILN